jgi:cardiolipin synthase (CMP-forming)
VKTGFGSAMVPEITPGSDMPGARALGRQSALLRPELNLPNLITLGRLLCVPFAIWLIADEQYGAAFWVFVGAGVSDALDGYIAKHFDRRTRLGALLDPVADKALLTGVYLSLGIVGVLPVWLVVLVVLRDGLIVAGFLSIQTTVVPQQVEPLFLSKINTGVQIALVGFVLARLGLGADAAVVTTVLVLVAAVTTVWSGLWYLVRWARIFLGLERVL